MKIAYLILLLSFTMQTALCKDISDKKKAKALNDQVNHQLQQLIEIKDSVSYYAAVNDIVRTAISCDNYDATPDEKGHINLKFRNENHYRITPLLSKIVDGGLFEYHRNRNVHALENFDLYLESISHPLFNKSKTLEKQIGKAAYYASLLAYGIKDYVKAEYYADLALKDNGFAKDAAEVKVLCMKEHLLTVNDSTKYVIALLELHDNAPENMNYFKMLMEYFTLPGHENEVGQFALDEINKNPQNKLAWVLKGETLMHKHQWDDAIAAYSQAVTIDSVFVPAIYNIGICYSLKAIEKKDSLEGNQKLSEEKLKTIKRTFESAKTFLERASALDPNHIEVDWVMPLYQVYYVLQDQRAEKIKKLIK